MRRRAPSPVPPAVVAASAPVRPTGRDGVSFRSMQVDIAIIGAGLTGLSLGVALAGAGRRVAVLDARAEPQLADDGFDVRIYAMGPASARWLEVSRAWSALDPARVAPVYDMSIRGDAPRGTAPDLALSAYRAGVGELCTIVEEREMARVLAAAARFAPNLEVVRPIGATALALDADAARVTLADGRVVEAQLVVGADGARSWARGAAGIAVDRFDYRQTAVVANFATEKPHHGVAHQWFRVEDDGAAGVLAWLPLPGRHISMVWSAPTPLAEALLGAAPEALAAQVAAAGSHLLGALTPIGRPAGFALVNQRAARLIAPRFALVGDAAHVLHPLAGQGLNLGFGDCAELHRVLDGARDCGETGRLRAYERARRSALAEMHALTHGIARLFAHPSPAVRLLRNAGLNLAGRLPVIPELLVRGAIRG